MVRRHAIVPQFGKRVTDVLKSMLRPALIPAEGKKLVVADWSSIEARVTPWCSGKPGEAKLDLFRNGEDVYKVNAAATFQCRIDEVTKDQRQVGKVQELACGFAGGVCPRARPARWWTAGAAPMRGPCPTGLIWRWPIRARSATRRRKW
jgi:hypothetical protein